MYTREEFNNMKCVEDIKMYNKQKEYIGRVVIEDCFRKGYWYSVEDFNLMFIEQCVKKYKILYITPIIGRNGGWAFVDFNDRMYKWLKRQCGKGLLNIKKIRGVKYYQKALT
jgi:hypothetical protein